MQGVLLVAALAAWSAAHAAPLTAAQEKVVRDATFEVVMRKPTDDPLTYEKPLPLDLLPFSIRSDTHAPVGTAFCIGANQYVTAAHVLGTSLGSFYGAPQVRDRAGKIHDIDQVLKYSIAEDFVVFSLREPPAIQPLPMNDSPVINSRVFAVGNALGDGIVMRDGVFTSETPEEMDGAWRWLRFSAAASPGSSGGPLLDESGNAIGLIIAASPNENLNFALPLSRIMAAPGTASFKTRSTFRLPVMSETLHTRLDETIPLPAPMDEFRRDAIELLNGADERWQQEYLQKYGGRIFPRGDKAQRLLYTPRMLATPFLVMEAENKEWDAQIPGGATDIRLDGDYFLHMGYIAGVTIMKLHHREDSAVARLFSDSRAYMDLLLQGLNFKRPVGPEQVTITSLGVAEDESEHVDSWGRKWQLRSWGLPSEDLRVHSLSLPLPDGCAIIMAVAPAGQSLANQRGLRTLSDFVYVSYFGSLAQWREFLSLEKWLPETFSNVAVDYEYAKHLRIRTRRFEFDTPIDLFPVTTDTKLLITPVFLLDGSQPRWDVAGFNLRPRTDLRMHLTAVRRAHPPESLGIAWQTEWTQMVNREAPYDGRVRAREFGSAIHGLVPARDHEDSDTGLFYQLSLSVDTSRTEAEMRAQLQLAIDGFEVLERP